nr:MAG TPA: hypothetical protein [Caudoviricetes sp.]
MYSPKFLVGLSIFTTSFHKFLVTYIKYHEFLVMSMFFIRFL